MPQLDFLWYHPLGVLMLWLSFICFANFFTYYITNWVLHNLESKYKVYFVINFVRNGYILIWVLTLSFFSILRTFVLKNKVFKKK